MRRRTLLGLAGGAALAPAASLAHAMPSTRAVLDCNATACRLTAEIPVSELEVSMGEKLGVGWREAVDAYLRPRVSLTGADGSGPIPAKLSMERLGREHPKVRAVFTFGPAPARVTLRYAAVVDRVASHYVLLYRMDERGELKPLARLQAPDFVAVASTISR